MQYVYIGNRGNPQAIEEIKSKQMDNNEELLFKQEVPEKYSRKPFAYLCIAESINWSAFKCI